MVGNVYKHDMWDVLGCVILASMINSYQIKTPLVGSEGANVRDWPRKYEIMAITCVSPGSEHCNLGLLNFSTGWHISHRKKFGTYNPCLLAEIDIKYGTMFS